MADLEPIKGLIELQDNFTSEIGLAQAALSNFTKENQESLKAVAGAAGLVAAALAATTAAVVALGVRGAEINDVRDSLETFAGGAKNADAAMQSLRDGTLGTIDNFTLAKEAAGLLSANVKLSAEDFKTLGAAAQGLSDRGLGDTKKLLAEVSDALVTGKSRALEAATGVLNMEQAVIAHAKALGVEKDELTEVDIAEAKRIEIMKRLSQVVKDAGDQQRDFGDILQAAKVGIQNWLDELGSAIAASPKLIAGMESLSAAIANAFGSENSTMIDNIVAKIEDGAQIIVNIGLAAIEAARVFNTAWAGIKTIVLGVETALMTMALAIVEIVNVVAQAAAALPGATQGMQDFAKATQEEAEAGRAMVASLAAQTAEAAQGVIQNDEFNRTLDEMGGALFAAKDAMNAATDATAANNEQTDIAANNTAKLAALQKDLENAAARRAQQEAKAAEEQKKAIIETQKLQADLDLLRTQSNSTSLESQAAAIEAAFTKQVAGLNKQSKEYENQMKLLRAIADEQLKAIESDWDSVKDKSIEAMNEQLQVAINTYNKMLTSGLHFSREVLDEQKRKIEDLKNAARGMGEEFQLAHAKAAEAAKRQADETKRLAEEAKKAADAARRMGGQFEVKALTKEEIAAQGGAEVLKAEVKKLEALYAQYPGRKPGGSGATGIAPTDRQGWEDMLREQIRYLTLKASGFALGVRNFVGGMAVVGESGPELVNLPRGADVITNQEAGRMTAQAGFGGTRRDGDMNLTFNVNGTASDVARRISDEIMRRLKTTRQFGSAA